MKGEVERCALFDGAFGPHTAAVTAHDPLGGGEADAVAAEFSVGVESLESAKVFTAEYRAEVVALYRTTDKSVAEIARELDLTASAVGRWVAQAEVDAGERAGLTTDEREELAYLRKENRILRDERDVLKRATAFFAKETR